MHCQKGGVVRVNMKIIPVDYKINEEHWEPTKINLGPVIIGLVLLKHQRLQLLILGLGFDNLPLYLNRRIIYSGLI